MLVYRLPWFSCVVYNNCLHSKDLFSRCCTHFVRLINPPSTVISTTQFIIKGPSVYLYIFLQHRCFKNRWLWIRKNNRWDVCDVLFWMLILTNLPLSLSSDFRNSRRPVCIQRYKTNTPTIGIRKNSAGSTIILVLILFRTKCKNNVVGSSLRKLLCFLISILLLE